ncbi:MAG: hypothetical protein B7Z66_15325 [Chromatiales bacterium 21-64-14]|nr:MAG: hypothetical protein B7Z66_15325 [Chromatiales bacterium 21-64-14]
MSTRSKTSVPGIYLITNTVTGVVYVGQAINIRKRWDVHRSTLSSGTHRNCYLQRAWAKYGAGAFSFSIFRDLSSTPPEERAAALNEAEIDCLASFQDTYNLMEAGISGVVASDAARALLSAQRKAMWADATFRERRLAALQALHGDPEFTARRIEAVREGSRTPEAKAARAAAAKTRWADPEFKALMAEKQQAKWADPAYRQKQKEARSKSWADPESRAKRIAGITEAMNRPEVKKAKAAVRNATSAKVSKFQLERWKDPEYRARQSVSRADGQSARFADPEARAEHGRRMKEVWAKRKAAKP